MPDRPVMLLAFSNDRAEFLPALEEERQFVEDALWRFTSDGLLEVAGSPGMTLERLFAFFRSEYYRERIRILHFAGHAEGRLIRLEDQDAATAGWSQLLGKLDLVFLNGCATDGQVETLLDAGVKAVIATTAKIADRKASLFSANIYRSLAAGNDLQTAFDQAIARLDSEPGCANCTPVDDPRGSFFEQEEGGGTSSTWRLYLSAPELKNWTVARAGEYDEDALRLKVEETEARRLEHRVLHFGSFAEVRTELAKRLRPAQGLAAAMVGVRVGRDAGQEWIVGNMLRDLVPFCGNNIKAPLNLNIRAELAPEPAFFWRELRRWFGLNADAVGTDLGAEMRDLVRPIKSLLETQPLIIRLYNDPAEVDIREIVEKISALFWQPLTAGLQKYLDAHPQDLLYPLVIMVVDPQLDEAIVRTNADVDLSATPRVDRATIETWMKWEEQHPAFHETLLSQKILDMSENKHRMSYYVGEEGEAPVRQFLLKICNNFDFRVEPDGTENRLLRLEKIHLPNPDQEDDDFLSFFDAA